MDRNCRELFADIDFEAEKWLTHYPDFKRDHELNRLEIIEGSSKPSDEGKTTHISQVTANKAIRLSKTWDADEWIRAVEFVAERFPAHYKRLLEIRWKQAAQIRDEYKKGRPAWVEDAILHYADQTGEWPHPNTISGWWRDMVVTLARWIEKRDKK